MQEREIGERIRRLRDAKVWTQEHLADAAGVAARTVQRAEEGSASAETLRALANALDLPVEELVRAGEQVLTPCLFYDDPDAALEWLPRAFGFEVVERICGADGKVMHAELAIGGARMMLGPSGWLPMITNPRAAKGVTQMVWVAVGDVDAHCARARAAGAQVVAEPQTQGYGKRTYRALDDFGHLWSFAAPA
jgi:uncharacterized glyoxalase superfamily protein PhnB/DNA-binding XRE family transcriptional regulator